MSTELPLTLQATQRETEKEPEYMLEVGGRVGELVPQQTVSLMASESFHCQERQLKEKVTNQLLSDINKGLSFLCTVLLTLLLF